MYSEVLQMKSIHQISFVVLMVHVKGSTSNDIQCDLCKDIEFLIKAITLHCKTPQI